MSQELFDRLLANNSSPATIIFTPIKIKKINQKNIDNENWAYQALKKDFWRKWEKKERKKKRSDGAKHSLSCCPMIIDYVTDSFDSNILDILLSNLNA